MEEIKKDGMAGKKGSSRTECCLSKIENLVAPARVALSQSANIWVGDLGASVHCTNNRSRGSNIDEVSAAGTMCAHDEAITASSKMDIARTWCNQFGEKQFKTTLRDVQYNPNLNFNLFSIGKVIKEGWKLSGNQEGLVLTKGCGKLVFDIKIKTQNGVIFCAYLWRGHEISEILASTITTMSIKSHRNTQHQ